MVASRPIVLNGIIIIGPLVSQLYISPCKPEDLYFKSINLTVDQYRAFLHAVGTGSVLLPHCDLDSGQATKAAEYSSRSVPRGRNKSRGSTQILDTTGQLHERYRLPISFSTASAAKSFRSRCGSVRGPPECSSQASPIAAPQVSQGTDNICFGVSSLVFTGL